MRSHRSWRGATLGAQLGALLALVGCAPTTAADVPVGCAAFRLTADTATEPTASDTLELVVVFDSLPRGSGGLRLRVDALAEAGMVTFAAPRPGSAAAGMSLQVPARYHGCAAMAPDGLELRASYPPREKAWVRVSTDRPVRLRIAGGDRTLTPSVTRPGESALVRWNQ
jgi:hypothetical protein